jgi:hypothetical protein
MKTHTAAASKKQQTSLLARFKDAKPEGGLPIFKFDVPGIAIAARFNDRRQIETKLGSGKCIDVDIIECSDAETTGPHTIFESKHITQILDSHPLSRGTRFYLRFHEVDPKSQFKRFVFELVDGNGNKPQDDNNIPF